jgi:hypothetical protein
LYKLKEVASAPLLILYIIVSIKKYGSFPSPWGSHLRVTVVILRFVHRCSIFYFLFLDEKQSNPDLYCGKIKSPIKPPIGDQGILIWHLGYCGDGQWFLALVVANA